MLRNQSKKLCIDDQSQSAREILNIVCFLIFYSVFQEYYNCLSKRVLFYRLSFIITGSHGIIYKGKLDHFLVLFLPYYPFRSLCSVHSYFSEEAKTDYHLFNAFV